MASFVLQSLPGWLAVRALVEAAALTMANAAFGHHLSKGNVESWFGFELAFHLDAALESHDWTALVGERRMDLLLVPRAMAKHEERLSLGSGATPSIAIEIREKRLASRGMYEDAAQRLAQDLEKLGPAPVRLGVLLTTDAVWTGAARDVSNKLEGDAVQVGEARLCRGLQRLARLHRHVARPQYGGRVWVDVVVPQTQRRALGEEGNVTYEDMSAFVRRAEAAFPSHQPVEEQARLAASARSYYDQYGEVPDAHLALQRCLCFEHRKLRDVGREPNGHDLEYQLKLYSALMG
ncbi:MAG: hypothetical protein KC766_32015 [Myxococcales bacterium]|nr:hypothetical protein [Myxococcales bacterium]